MLLCSRHVGHISSWPHVCLGRWSGMLRWSHWEPHLHLSGRRWTVRDGTRLVDEHGISDRAALCKELLLLLLVLLVLLLQVYSTRVRDGGIVLAIATSHKPWRVLGHRKTLTRMLRRCFAVQGGSIMQRFAGVALQHQVPRVSAAVTK